MQEKISIKDWRNLPADKWTVTTVRQYLADQHEQHYGIPYTARNFAIEGKWLKSMIAEHGAEVVRLFIDGCFAEYKPTPQYPGLNFAFMWSYQRPRVLPRVLADKARKERAEILRSQQTAVNEDLSEWL